MVLAPLILGAVMNKMKSGGAASPQGRQGSPGGGGMDMLGSILGQSGGSEVAGSLLGSVLGGGGANAGGGLSSKAGCHSSILGGLLGGRK